MYIDISKSRGKYIRYLLRATFREKGKVKHRTVANLSRCTDEEIQAIRFALRYRKHLAVLAAIVDLPLNQLSKLPEMIRTTVKSQSTLEAVMERGYLRAGVRSDLLHFGVIEKNGNHVGFEIDLVAQMANRLGVGYELVPVTSASRIPLLIQGRIDLIAATLTHYRKRDELIDYSIGYFQSPQAVMVKKGRGIRSLSDLADRQAGAAEGSAGAENFKTYRLSGDIKTFPTHPAVFQSLQKDAIDAFVSDWVILASLQSCAPNGNELEILFKDAQFGGGYYGIGVRENDSRWRDTINSILQDIWRDGSWDHIFKRWFGPSTPLALNKEDLFFQMPLWS